MVTTTVGDIFLDIDLDSLSRASQTFFLENLKKYMQTVTNLASPKRIKILYHELLEPEKTLVQECENCNGYPLEIAKNVLKLVIKKENKYFKYLIDTNKMELQVFFEKRLVQEDLKFFSLTLQNLDCVIFNLFLVKYNCLIVHSSAFIYANKAYLFLGHSGYGKSTIYNLIKTKVPNSEVLSQDRNMLFLRDNKVYLAKFWREFAPFQEDKFYNKMAILEKAFFIEKSNLNTKESVSTKISRLKISNLFYRFSNNKQFLIDATNLIFNFTKFFDNFYLLEFTKDNKFIAFINSEIKNKK